MEVVSKPCQDQFLHPILVHSISEKKENSASQMGHTKKIILKKMSEKRCVNKNVRTFLNNQILKDAV